jgi:hypothetical protein
MKSMRSRKVGTLPNGIQVHRVPVRVLLNDSRRCETVESLTFEVLATSVADAANYIRHEYRTRPETEVIAYGPKGGETRRYVGWDSAIHALMCAAHDARKQLALPLQWAGHADLSQPLMGAAR